MAGAAPGAPTPGKGNSMHLLKSKALLAAALLISTTAASLAEEARIVLSPAQLASSGLPEGLTAESVAALPEMSLRLRRNRGEIEGTLRTEAGELAFHSYTIGGGLVRVEYDLAGRGTFGLLVDNQQRTAEPSYPKGLRMTKTERFLFRSLAYVVARRVGNKTPEADALLRGANLWGAHPLSPVKMGRIVAPQTRSWTNLCGITSKTLYHDGGSHGLIGETLATGPNAYNCRSRCGAGCDAIIGTSAWTADCGEHDRCEQHHSCCSACQDEFNSASDDYIFAPNCTRSGW